MRLKALTAVAALLVISACATAPEESSDASGSGGAVSTSSSQTTQASTGATQGMKKSNAPELRRIRLFHPLRRPGAGLCGLRTGR